MSRSPSETEHGTLLCVLTGGERQLADSFVDSVVLGLRPGHVFLAGPSWLTKNTKQIGGGWGGVK